MSNCGLTLIMLTLVAISTMATLTLADEYFYIKNEVETKATVQFRCQSGDEDTGMRELHGGDTFEYPFDGMWPNTLYFCHFYLDNKDAVFNVWVYKTDKEGCTVWKEYPWYLPDLRIHNGQVEWVIRNDGFYKHCVYRKKEVDDEGRIKKLPLESALHKQHDW